MGESAQAIAGYGICLAPGVAVGNAENDDYKVVEAISKATGVTFDRWHCLDEVGGFLSLAHTNASWDGPEKLNLDLPDNPDEKLREALKFIWENHESLAQRYNLPKPEEAKFGWFLYAYYW